MKSEDGTGSRHALWVLKRCGIVTPPISFVLTKDFLTTSALYNIMIQQTILLIAPIGHQFGDESLCESLVEIRGSLRLIKKSPLRQQEGNGYTIADITSKAIILYQLW